MITPETKDWTWVLDRPCPDCGFDPSAWGVTALSVRLGENASAWQRSLREGRIQPGRPDSSTWSSLEYACHLRDAFGHLDRRIGLMVTEEDPQFAFWDQDASANDEHYDQQDPVVVVAELTAASDALAARLEGLSAAAW